MPCAQRSPSAIPTEPRLAAARGAAPLAASMTNFTAPSRMARPRRVEGAAAWRWKSDQQQERLGLGDFLGELGQPEARTQRDRGKENLGSRLNPGKAGANGPGEGRVPGPMSKRWASPWRTSSNYVTGPPSETPRDLADFQSRHGEAPRFAGKGQEIALDRCRMEVMRGPFSRTRRASSQGWKGGSYPPGRGSNDPPSKSRTPLVFSSCRCRSRASNGHFSPSLF
jgi:hypothetical protein